MAAKYKKARLCGLKKARKEDVVMKSEPKRKLGPYFGLNLLGLGYGFMNPESRAPNAKDAIILRCCEHAKRFPAPSFRPALVQAPVWAATPTPTPSVKTPDKQHPLMYPALKVRQRPQIMTKAFCLNFVLFPLPVNLSDSCRRTRFTFHTG